MRIISVNGLRVDAAAIGAGMYRLIVAKGDEAIVAYGMIPLYAIEVLRRELRAKIMAVKAAQIGVSVRHLLDAATDDGPLSFDEKTIARTITEIERAVVVEIYKAASTAGKMVA